MNADRWRSWGHDRHETPLDQAGALRLLQAPSHEHLGLAKHLTAVKNTEEFVADKGVVTRWERLRKKPLTRRPLQRPCRGTQGGRGGCPTSSPPAVPSASGVNSRRKNARNAGFLITTEGRQCESAGADADRVPRATGLVLIAQARQAGRGVSMGPGRGAGG